MDTPALNHLHYIRLPRLSVRSGLSLGRVLLTLVPEEPGPAVEAAASAVQARLDELEVQWKARHEPRVVENPRPYDRRLGRACSAVEAGLARYSIVESEEPDHQRAAELHARLFPNGLAFTRLPYMEQHAECKRLVDLIDEEDLREDLDRLVGEAFIDELLEAQEAYGEVLGITEQGDRMPPAVSLQPSLRALTRAISVYALQVLGFAEFDPEANMDAARRALEPIPELRRANAHRRAGRTGSELDQQSTDDEPVLDADVDPVMALV